MENREGIQPESMKPLPGATPPATDAASNGKPEDAMREGLPPAPPIGAETDDVEEPTSFFTPGKLILLAIMAALAAYLLWNLEIWPLIKAALGLSFVIFIHELGHFLAAKWCNVHVTTFSIGFGPPIPGCWFQYGETTYKLAIVPLGGYVQMVGQVDGDEGADDSDDPRSYRRKTVSQRMLIISAGVIMNAILAACCFIAMYQGSGKEYPAAVISYTDSYGPAWRQGFPTGAAILKIGDVETPTFNDLTMTVINSPAGAQIPVTYRLPGGDIVETTIEPRKDKGDSRPVLGLSAPQRTQLVYRRARSDGPYRGGTPAEAAKFEFGDVIVAMTAAPALHPDDPKADKDEIAQLKEYRSDRVTPLPDDPRHPGHGQTDYFEFQRRLQLLADKEIVVRVRRGEEPSTQTVDLKVAPMFRLDLGAAMKMGEILAIRQGSSAAEQIQVKSAENSREGDRIEAVSVQEADKTETVWSDGKTLDPERLPTQLRQWSDRLDRANFKGDRKVTLQVRRHREGGGEQYEKKTIVLKWDSAWRFDRGAPISLDAPMPIPELGLAYQIRAFIAHTTRKDSPLQVGDEVVNFTYEFEGSDSRTLKDGVRKPVEVKWSEQDLKPGQWAALSFQLFQESIVIKKLTLKVKRGAATEEVQIPIHTDSTWPLQDRGWSLSADVRRIKASGPIDALRMGLTDTHRRMTEIFLNLRGMVTRRISVDQFGGPLTIAAGAYQFAGRDLADFLFFIGLISINLAVVNFLPIPILDGGHMVFLIYEKIRGRPASEMVRIIATYIGLAIVACLMLFVLYLDFNRWILPLFR